MYKQALKARYRAPFYLTYYTLADLIAMRIERYPSEASNPDLILDAMAGHVELRSKAAYGKVFVDWDNFMCARNQHRGMGAI